MTQRPEYRPDWRLPRGVPRGLWEYMTAEHIAGGYDTSLADDNLCRLDMEVVERVCDRPGLVADLGCGTGRAILELARRGHRGLAVDLSLPMLRIVARQATQEQLPVDVLRANLVELDGIRDQSVDNALCLYSTLGMIRGREARQAFLRHVRRIVRPDGAFVLHVHNLWANLWHPAGRQWLWGHFRDKVRRSELELGDKQQTIHGVPNVLLHLFTRRQLQQELWDSGWRIAELIPLCREHKERLASAWFIPGARANGWIVVCK
ncbi:MAG: class I SAM-dependent methyltransferase [Planctomycetes bacterium]|nr:class I SAM-dependent methyltransferase [Planctomycetota bacterium]